MPRSRTRRQRRPGPDDIAHIMAAVDAAARGDIEGAIHHELAGLVVEGSLTVACLQDLAAHDPAPAWACSRWCVDQAMRWLLLHEDPRVDEVVRLTLGLMHADHLPDVVDDPVALQEYGTLVAATDWVCHQLAVFEYGGLADFLARRAERPLLERCDRIDEWPTAPMGVYSVLGTQGPELVLRDLVAGVDVSVLNLGASADRGRDALLLGRLVPISVEPGLMFESRPLQVDEDSAAAAVRSIGADPVHGWLLPLADAREEGRLERGFSCRDMTLFTSDLTVLPPDVSAQPLAPRLQQLVDAGVSPTVANAVGVLEVALIAAEVTPEALGAVTPHVLVAMSVPGAFECARRECVSADHAVGWERLAGATYGVVAERCRELARAARAG